MDRLSLGNWSLAIGGPCRDGLGRPLYCPARESALAITDRKHERRPFSYPGWIELGAGVELVPCHIEDVSEGGAKLTVPNVHPLPERFRLRLSLTSQVSRSCIVKRRLSDGVGLQFIKQK
jgi:hypothetical protein